MRCWARSRHSSERPASLLVCMSVCLFVSLTGSVIAVARAHGESRCIMCGYYGKAVACLVLLRSVYLVERRRAFRCVCQHEVLIRKNQLLNNDISVPSAESPCFGYSRPNWWKLNQFKQTFTREIVIHRLLCSDGGSKNWIQHPAS